MSTQPAVPIEACSALCTKLSTHSRTLCASANTWSGQRSLLPCESIEVAGVKCRFRQINSLQAASGSAGVST